MQLLSRPHTGPLRSLAICESAVSVRARTHTLVQAVPASRPESAPSLTRPERLYTQPSIDTVVKPALPANPLRGARFVPRYGSPERAASPSRRAPF